VDKPWIEWTDEERRRVQYDCNAKNIITSSLSMDDFFWVSQCKSAKENVGCPRGYTWGDDWSEKNKKACLDSRVWAFQDAKRKVHSWSAKEVHSHSQPSHGSRQRIWQRGDKHQSA